MPWATGQEAASHQLINPLQHDLACPSSEKLLCKRVFACDHFLLQIYSLTGFTLLHPFIVFSVLDF